uniref:receptor protein serine/threonine kinase n=1 Tax=Phallusia mammillata TaxID=59560 RepID=A0A6F9D756_9ASCI|nr:TGFbeta receptor-Ib [Phallusia mammillata]
MEEIRCRCLLDCPDLKFNSTCLLKPNAKCYKKLFINEDGEEELHAGCLPSQASKLDQCSKYTDPDFTLQTDLKCCNNGSMCNDQLHVSLHKPTENEENGYNIIIAIITIIFFLLFSTVVFWYTRRLCRREAERRRQIENENKNANRPVLHGRNGKHRGGGEMMNDWSSLVDTSSGSGMPLLTQRTVSKQIETVKEIGRGRYGTVMLGKWREEKVALKIFNSTDEDSWFRETEIYQTVLLRHENILGFIAADISGTGSWTQLFLITEYHENGSLFDYLQRKTVSVSEALKLAHTACSGLAHLHMEITGTKGKPAIAHRDIKSKNILVKQDGQCCIADMGLAVRYSRAVDKVDVGTYDRSRRQGTIRYMAPEVLAQRYHFDSFEAYTASDVYSFALVMWEILNRTDVGNGLVENYHVPYYDMVGADPDFDEMRKVVVAGNVRPEIMKHWVEHPVLSVFVTTMRECWSSRPESRLAMLRVRKTLRHIVNGFQKPEESSNSASDSSGSDRKPSESSSSEPLTSTTDPVEGRPPNAEPIHQTLIC